MSATEQLQPSPHILDQILSEYFCMYMCNTQHSHSLSHLIGFISITAQNILCVDSESAIIQYKWIKLLLAVRSGEYDSTFV